MACPITTSGGAPVFRRFPRCTQGTLAPRLGGFGERAEVADHVDETLGQGMHAVHQLLLSGAEPPGGVDR